ncbi:3-deoxy-manno-octulosonate cytidylyltransferase [Marinomonas sp. S3726]|uniref:3-deoxy-manno-octulosonate cytidylyltransferase n=1 Tax=Marinomonas sp. S3726 TaxID=579484 RepID=UPI0005FA3ACE|nr:3-deoxy-manno-octulosonate cytidylyltransferase [Marinomonas sp. S3726]KJZ15941.1 3-deoxy-manno-octulosonate cytidylyltransferase [Marinomonas sp. S3726]
MRSVVIIPARYQSSRYPGKPLVALLGKAMVLWVAELCTKAVGHENTYVATDDELIAKEVVNGGYNVVMTNSDALTGTDRLAQAAEKIEADIYINVQGDEPLVCPEDIIKIRDAKLSSMDKIINGYTWISEHEDPHNVNIPKVLTNENDEMIYMSRLALPGYKEIKNAPKSYKKQVCIYAFTKDELMSFVGFGRKSIVESSEDIEILRFLDLGKSIKMIETKPNSLAVDMPEDVARVELALRELHNL